MVIQNNYFDLFDIFVNELIGDIWLAIIIGIIVMFFLSIKFKLPYQVSVLLCLLWLMIVFAATFLDIIWVFIILTIAFLFYYRIKQGFER